MKNKGFTLIELLAVIVILAIISLIAFPTLTKVVDNARLNAAIQSANGYVDSINTQIISSELSTSSKNIVDGTYNINELDINIKGKKPDNGIVTVENKSVKEARLCLGKYSVDYDGHDTKLSSNNYCGDTKVTILSNGKEVNNPSKGGNTYTVDLTDKTNINCSNGAVPEISGNTLTVKNAIGNTTCDIGSSLKYTFTHLNDGDNNIIMVSDENSSDKEVVVEKNNIVNFNLNGKTLNIKMIGIKGKLNAFDNDKQGKIISVNNTFNQGNSSVLSMKDISIESVDDNGVWISSTCNKCTTLIANSDIVSNKRNAIGVNGSATKSVVTISNNSNLKSLNSIAIYNNNDNEIVLTDSNVQNYTVSTTILNAGKGIIEINGGKYINNGTGVTLDNHDEGLLNIKSGIIISNESYAIANSGGTININQKTMPIYISSLAQKWMPAINNKKDSKIKISAIKSNNCTSNSNDTKQGLCVFAIGDGNGDTSTNGNVAVQNSGSIFINGGTYIGGWSAIYGGGNGSLSNVTNAEIIGGRNGVGLSQYPTAILNICNSTIKANVFDIANLSNDNTSVISYSNTVSFNDGTNTPKVWNPNGTINANYMGTCTE